ncbi:hypothetical protein BH10PSE1_BH10PSE1_07900 [soil metagenome]
MRIRSLLLASAAVLAALPAAAQTTPAPAGPDGRLFHAPLDTGYAADQAVGLADPLFVDQVTLTPDGAQGGAARAADAQILAWAAPGNIYAQRGTLSFFWRSHQPIGQRQFVIFRVGYPEHTSWDMTFLRLDWNGHGFDAFVTDANLARVRVSFDAPAPSADTWTHLAVAWDETSGLTLYVDGKPAAKTSQTAVLDNGLFAFGPHSRIIAGYQVQSAYDYQRGGDVDEVSTFDHRLSDADVAGLAAHQQPTGPAFPARDPAVPSTQAEWRMRYGFNRPADPPPYLSAPSTTIRVVRPTEARDIRALFSKGDDGIRESTWPGVYNRSRLPGRHDYFVLPDWNVYEAGGKALTLSLPDEAWNRIEIQGAADGTLSAVGPDGEVRIGARPRGQERTTLQLVDTRTGGAVRFDNRVQETPIREIGVYDVRPGEAPVGSASLEYVVTSSAATTAPTLDELNTYIAGRFVPDERQTVVALPPGAPKAARLAAAAATMPLVHILIPADFRDVTPGGPPARFDYGWGNMRDGLDGFVIQIPALTATPTHDDLIALNIRIKDPIWPDRDLLDVNVSVKPGEARTLWLDTRDRFLPNDRSLYLTVASASPNFNAESLDGMRIRLVFKPRKQVLAEHVADREEQIRANLAWFVEEQPNNRLLPIYERFDREVTDLLRVDPDNVTARIYWNEQNGNQPYPAFVQSQPAPGVPLWAHRQIEDLKQVERFVNWWIDHRQIPAGEPGAGELGGGLSDDSDLLHQWAPLYLMGANPQKMRDSQSAALDAIYRSGMLTEGLNTIRADELHSYEEGVNTVAQYAMMNWGSPRAIERLMATARRYPEMTAVNPAGHRHFTSNSFSWNDFSGEGPWGRQKGNNFLMFHPGILLVQWNGSPATRDIILQTLDGFLAHQTPASGGGVTLASPIDWTTDIASTANGALGNTTGAGLTGSATAFWAGYEWTHDAKYLQPLLPGAPNGVNSLGPDVMSELGKRETWGPIFVAAANAADTYRLSNTGGAGSPLSMARYGAWQTTGDKSYLEALYAAEIQSATQRMDMMTSGELWTDRVQIPSELLQRSRLGGIGARRGQTFPGNVVSWSFSGPDSADSVAILMPEATPDHFKVILFNAQDHVVNAVMTGAGVAPGQWTVTQGPDADADDRADTPVTSTITFEPGAGLPINLPPKQATVLELRLAQAGIPMSQRPDVGLDAEDAVVSRHAISVTVHGLGGVASLAGEVRLENARGDILSRSPFDALAAPTDLLPKTQVVSVPLPPSLASGETHGLIVRLMLDGEPAEISRNNNWIILP